MDSWQLPSQVPIKTVGCSPVNTRSPSSNLNSWVDYTNERKILKEAKIMATGH